MVKQSMDLLELLRKRGMEGTVDFLREAGRFWWKASWTLRYLPRPALGRANATRSAAPTATAPKLKPR